MRATALISVALSLLTATAAHARESGITASGDGRYVLIQKDVGDARWAINLDLQNDYRMTGNIFSASAAPVFVDCHVTSIDHNGSESIADWTFSYQCSLTRSCDDHGCPGWEGIDDAVVLPGTFFSVTEPETQPTPTRTPTPIRTSTPGPTTQSTPIVTSSLTGMIGTWDFTFTISSTFTFTYRMQQIVSSNGETGLATLNEFGERQFVFRVQDLQPGSSLPYEFVMISNEQGILCNYYVWNRNGGSVSGMNFPLLTKNGQCDINTLINAYAMVGVRTASTADARGLDAFGPPLTDVLITRADRARSEVESSAHGAGIDLTDLVAVGAAAIDTTGPWGEVPPR